jgi:hypothetical protein
MRLKPHERVVSMQDAQKAALDALAKMLEDQNLKPELRIEAAKIILNRPRFFVGPDVKEA